MRSGIGRDRCLQLLGQIELDDSRVRSVPVQWDFSGEHGLIHPWDVDDRGSVRIEPGALVWESQGDAREADRLIAGFAFPNPAPSALTMTVTAEKRAGRLRVFARDRNGRIWVLPRDVELPQNRTRTVRVAMADLKALDDQTATLDASQLDQVVIENATIANTFRLVAFGVD